MMLILYNEMYSVIIDTVIYLQIKYGAGHKSKKF